MTAATNASRHGSHSHRERVENLDQNESDVKSDTIGFQLRSSRSQSWESVQLGPHSQLDDGQSPFASSVTTTWTVLAYARTPGRRARPQAGVHPSRGATCTPGF